MFDDLQIAPHQLLSIPVFLLSLTVHEFAHALVATQGGDDTPRLQGRLTLNPGPHIDLFGTIIIPLINLFSSIPLIGWAKPVQVNPARFKNQLWMVWVAIAGPISNVLLAVLAAILLKLGTIIMGKDLPEAAQILGFMFILINISLAIFNMLPIPPLDGSRVLFHFGINGRPSLYPAWEAFERYSIFVLYFIIIATPTSRALLMLMQLLTTGLLWLFGLN
ncbi:MAG: site-2 protease family protein [Candidatus Sumerlaeaceae bacterium]